MKSVLDVVKKLSFLLTKKQKVWYFIIAFIGLIGAACELLGVTACLPFIEAMMAPSELEGKWYYTLIVELFNPETDIELMTILGVAIIIIYIVKNIFLIFSTYMQSWYSTGVQRDLSIKLTDIFLKSSYSYHLDINSSVLIRSINTDVVGVFAVSFYIFRIIAEVCTAAAISIYIVLLDPVLALSLVAVLGSCMSILFLVLKRLMRRYGITGQECEGKMLQYLTQAFTGVKEIMVMNRQEYFENSFNKACATNARISKKTNVLNVSPTNVYEAVCIGGLFAVVIFRLHFTADITEFVTKLAIVAVAAFRLFPSVGRLTTNFNALSYNRPRLDSIYKMVQDVEAQEMYKNRIKAEDKEEKLSFVKEIKIDNITWKYPAGKDNVLENLNLTINKGESIALIGPSGAGKTTLADIILGLLKPQKGSVYVDGKDIYENPKGWSKIVGYVPQSVYLIDDTIRKNVAFGIYDDEIDDEKVWRAIREAQLEDFIKQQENGIDTMVGERGVRLSGGQRQRIAIARALYENPDILVLDEATSALDNETETAVMEAIDSLHGTKTMVIVAHRLSTIRNCDSIYEIQNGLATKKVKEEVLS